MRVVALAAYLFTVFVCCRAVEDCLERLFLLHKML